MAGFDPMAAPLPPAPYPSEDPGAMPMDPTAMAGMMPPPMSPAAEALAEQIAEAITGQVQSTVAEAMTHPVVQNLMQMLSTPAPEPMRGMSGGAMPVMPEQPQVGLIG